MNGNNKFVRECSTTDCPSHPFRKGKSAAGLNPLKAIRAHCLDCQGESPKDIQVCDPNLLSGVRCPFYEYRLGNTGRKLSEAEKAQRKRASSFLGEKPIFDQPRIEKEVIDQNIEAETEVL